MPTGYTADIAKGITFGKFAMQCARNFGACIDLRDEPWDAPIPEKFEPSDYYTERIAETKAELARLTAMSDADARSAAYAEFAEATEAFNRRKQERTELRAKYEAMLAQARAWEPPTSDHRGLKDFMLEQITESIKWDCNDSYDKAPELLDGATWREKKIGEARRDLAYAEQHEAEERHRCETRSLWVKALRDSLVEVS